MTSTRFRVEWTDDAEGDARRVVEYFENSINADRVIGRFDKKVAGLGIFPEIGRIVPELDRIGIAIYREILVGPWRIIYEVRGSVIYIMAVFDGRRDLADVLFNRFVRA